MLDKRNPLVKAIKLALLTAAAASTVTTAQVWAEEDEAKEEKSATKIVITGSRLKSENLTSVSPLQTISSEDITASGATNLQELLLENPTFGSPAISRTNSNFSTTSAGVALVDLRNLGSDRTLVLVNGRRMISGVPGSQSVDLNTIPTQFIEKVEILTGGASSVYGSDAVAGVVNLIMKTDYEGLLVETQYGKTSRDDNETRRISLTSGIDGANGKGNMMFHLSYSDEGPVYSKDRDISAVDQFSTFALTDDPADFFGVTRPFYSSFPPQGRFDAGGIRFTYNQNGEIQDNFSTNGNGTIGPDGFNRSEFRTIAIPTERYLFASNGTYHINNEHTAYFEGTFANSQTKTQLEPFPFASDDIYANGVVPLEFMVNGVAVRNPYVPDDIWNAAVDQDGDGLRDLAYFARRLSDIANRGNVADRDTFRFVAGLKGDVFEGWSYDLFYSYGSTKESQVSSGQVNVMNFRNALESIVDVFDYNQNGLTNDAVCLDATARDQGCVPINIYGFNSITPEMAAYVNAPGLQVTFVSQEVVGGSLAGEIMDLPAGPLGVAVGFEYREEFSRDEFDALQQAGLNAGNAIPATKGEYDVSETYAEFNIPVFEGFEIRAAVRGSDYSTVGSVTSWNAGINWQINDTFRTRLIQAQSTRAPNIGELFSPPSQTFPQVTDPCDGVTADTTGVTAERCRADAGVAANIAANGAFTLTQADLQGVSGFTRGNPNAQEEVGKSTTFGLIITPTDIDVLEDFSFTMDYYDIEIEDALVPTGRQFILDQCYGGGDTSFCDFVTRRQAAIGSNNAGSLEFIDTAVTNSGGKEVEGVDLTMTYSADIGPGKFNTRLAYTRLLDSYDIPEPGADKDTFLDEIGASQDKANLAFNYKWNDFDLAMGINYQSSAHFDDQFLKSVGLEAESFEVASQTYVDMQFKYNVLEDVEWFAGIDNMFDKAPPLIVSGLGSDGNTGTETASNYDAIGRRWYTGFRVQF